MGFALLEGIETAISVCGSARSREGSPEYESARGLSRSVATADFNVLTGGGPGVKKAASVAAKRAVAPRQASMFCCPCSSTRAFARYFDDFSIGSNELSSWSSAWRSRAATGGPARTARQASALSANLCGHANAERRQGTDQLAQGRVLAAHVRDVAECQRLEVSDEARGQVFLSGGSPYKSESPFTCWGSRDRRRSDSRRSGSWPTSRIRRAGRSLVLRIDTSRVLSSQVWSCMLRRTARMDPELRPQPTRRRWCAPPRGGCAGVMKLSPAGLPLT